MPKRQSRRVRRSKRSRAQSHRYITQFSRLIILRLKYSSLPRTKAYVAMERQLQYKDTRFHSTSFIYPFMQAATLSWDSTTRHDKSALHALHPNRKYAHLVLNNVGIDLPSFLSRHRRMDNDIIALLPVHGSCYLVPVCELKSWKGNRGSESMEVNVGNLQHTVDNTGHKIISICNSLRVLSDRPNDLIEVATRRGRITQREADNLFGINHKHRPDL